MIKKAKEEPTKPGLRETQPASRRSGVKSIIITVDGRTQQPTASQTCPGDSCRLTRKFVLDTDYMEDGPYRVAVTATDQIGNSTTQEWTVEVTSPDAFDSKIDPVDDTAPASAPEQYGGGRAAAPFCEPDPDYQGSAAALNQFCSGNDLTNLTVQELLLEPSVGETRVSAAEAGTSLGWGVAHEVPDSVGGVQPGMFNDQRFRNLGVRYVRKILPWDIMLRDKLFREAAEEGGRERLNYRCATQQRGSDPGYDDFSLPEFYRWYERATRLRLRVLVSFGATRSRPYYCYLPTPSEYQAALLRFRREFPAVKTVSSWNEPNHSAQPTSRKHNPYDCENCPISRYASDYRNGAYVAGRLWRKAKEICDDPAKTNPSLSAVYAERLPRRSYYELSDRPPNSGTPGTDNWNQPMLDCAVLAGEFLDDETFAAKSNKDTGNKPEFKNGDFFDDYVRGMGTDSKLWAWHAYGAAYSGEYRVSNPDFDRSKPRSPDNPKYLGRRTNRNNERFRAFVRSIPDDAKVWLTEQGGLVHKHRVDAAKDDQADESVQTIEGRADADLRHLLYDFAPGFSKVSRFYVYQWQRDPREPAPPKVAWDSGLIRLDGSTRHMYTTFYDRVCPVDQATGQRCEPLTEKP